MASATINNLNDSSHPRHTPGNGVGGAPGTHEEHASFVGDSSNSSEQGAGNAAARQRAAERSYSSSEGMMPPAIGITPLPPQ